MNVVFFGTPLFAAHCLEYLIDHQIQVVAVVTQPDRPKGRSLKTLPSAVKSLILEKNPSTPILQPEKSSDPHFLERLKSFGADLFVVVAFGQILPQKLLDIPPLGCINVHASLLPKYRGAAPIQRSIMEGEKETGISIQKMVRKLDAGDVISEAKTPIAPNMTFGELETKLIALAQPLLYETILEFQKGVPQARAQIEEDSTYASKIDLSEGEIHWNLPAEKIHNLVRAFSPKPGAWCWVYTKEGKKRLKILRTSLVSGIGKPGEILGQSTQIACGEGALELIEVQPEGKKAMKAADWMRGQKNIHLSD